MSDEPLFRIDAAGDVPDRTIATVHESVAYVVIASANGTWDTGDEVSIATIRNLRPRLGSRVMSDGIAQVVAAHRAAYEAEAVPHDGSGAIDLMLARVTASTIDLGWSGACRAFLVHGGTIIRHARPHCHGEDFVSATSSREQAYALYDGRMFMRKRMFGEGMRGEPEEPDVERLDEPWPFVSGDRLVMMNDRVWRTLSDEEILRRLTLARPAQMLVEPGLQGGWKAAAIVVERV